MLSSWLVAQLSLLVTSGYHEELLAIIYRQRLSLKRVLILRHDWSWIKHTLCIVHIFGQYPKIQVGAQTRKLNWWVSTTAKATP